MQFWVYMLRCSDGSYYTGHTDRLEHRLAEHVEGLGGDWTRRRRPVELVWCADAPTREEALAFELRVKNWSRAKKEALIAGDWARVGHFARPPRERPSTSLGTNDEESAQQSPDWSRAGHFAHPTSKRPSTLLGTNDDGRGEKSPFVPGEVEARRVEAAPPPAPPASGRGA